MSRKNKATPLHTVKVRYDGYNVGDWAWHSNPAVLSYGPVLVQIAAVRFVAPGSDALFCTGVVKADHYLVSPNGMTQYGASPSELFDTKEDAMASVRRAWLDSKLSAQETIKRADNVLTYLSGKHGDDDGEESN